MSKYKEETGLNQSDILLEQEEHEECLCSNIFDKPVPNCPKEFNKSWRPRSWTVHKIVWVIRPPLKSVSVEVNT